MVCTTVWVRGLIRDSEPSAVFAAHTAPAPYASPSGLVPTGTDRPARPSEPRRPTLLAGNVSCPADSPAATPMNAPPSSTSATAVASSRRAPSRDIDGPNTPKHAVPSEEQPGLPLPSAARGRSGIRRLGSGNPVNRRRAGYRLPHRLPGALSGTGTVSMAAAGGCQSSAASWASTATPQPLKRLARADAELVGERLINPPVGCQRIRLAARHDTKPAQAGNAGARAAGGRSPAAPVPRSAWRACPKPGPHRSVLQAQQAATHRGGRPQLLRTRNQLHRRAPPPARAAMLRSNRPRPRAWPPASNAARPSASQVSKTAASTADRSTRSRYPRSAVTSTAL